MPQIELKTMKYLVGRIHVTNYLYFTKEELDAKGTRHNKPVYITIRYKVFIDNGSALNVLQNIC
jgi:hypothetical protein